MNDDELHIMICNAERMAQEAVYEEMRIAILRPHGLYKEGVDHENLEDLIQTIILRLKRKK